MLNQRHICLYDLRPELFAVGSIKNAVINNMRETTNFIFATIILLEYNFATFNGKNVGRL